MPRVEVHSFQVVSKVPDESRPLKGDGFSVGSNCELYDSPETALRCAREYQQKTQRDNAVAITVITELATLSDAEVAQLPTGLAWGSAIDTQTIQLVEVGRTTFQLDASPQTVQSSEENSESAKMLPEGDWNSSEVFPTLEEASFFEFPRIIGSVATLYIVETLVRYGFTPEPGKIKAAYVFISDDEKTNVYLVYLLGTTAYSWSDVNPKDSDYQTILEKERQIVSPVIGFYR